MGSTMQGGGGRLPFYVPLGVTSVSRKFRFTFQKFRFTFQKVPFRESSVYVSENPVLRKFRFTFQNVPFCESSIFPSVGQRKFFWRPESTSVSVPFQKFRFAKVPFSVGEVPFCESSVLRWRKFRFAKVPFSLPSANGCVSGGQNRLPFPFRFRSSVLRKFRFTFQKVPFCESSVFRWRKFRTAESTGDAPFPNSHFRYLQGQLPFSKCPIHKAGG